MPSFYEFFAGGGMARAGLGSKWTCLFANDIDPKKAASYERNWGCGEMSVKDVGVLTTDDLPSMADLVWASFPCQDLSLAGMGAGLKGARSGAFWPFWRLMQALEKEGRAPAVVVLENVCGALTSHEGSDFRSLVDALRSAGYRCGGLVIDAALFLPHSRPRLFVIGIRHDIASDPGLISDGPRTLFHTDALITAHATLSQTARASWVWWNLPTPARRAARLADIIEPTPAGVDWHTSAQTRTLLNMMSPVNRAKVSKAKRMNRLMVGSLYKRTRVDREGVRAQRAEIRFDDVAGCLRTPNGGSSRQTIMTIEGDQVRSRLLSPRETARLMGLPDTYLLPSNYNEAYHLSGDGVVVPVVRHLSHHLIEPLLKSNRIAAEAA
ncbi:MAG TPA: DNA cytosine methyltransferase [Bryobacteraceae bacterium]|nr:DNA cytosine methyltransferase [Bryobacteraceae bacterium]